MDPISLEQPRLTSFYLEYLEQKDIAKLVGQARRDYSQTTLQRLTGSLRVETRRAATMVLGFLGDYASNAVLGRLLHDADRSVQLLAEKSIKSVWTRDGSDRHRQALAEVMRRIAAQQFDEAVRIANNLLEEAPLFAEARNQRAIALFALGDFENAIEDGALTLDFNPFHFGAAIGMGHAYLQLKNRELAIQCFQQALKINPTLESVRRHLARMVY